MVIDETDIETFDDDHYDDRVEEEIRSCFSRENPKCFFVSAGAGSGKTRKLNKHHVLYRREDGKMVS